MSEPMSTEEYAEMLANTGFYDEIIDEMFWEREQNKTDKLLDVTIEHAKAAGVVLTDAETWGGYDEYFGNMYACTEKGLS